jgi:uncharacterized membrane protein
MAVGYGFGAILEREPRQRQRWCLTLGLAATALFVVLAAAALRQPSDVPALFRVLNQRKYPASVPFLLMTLGPAIALLPLAARARGPIARGLETFGRVPLFYYLLHIPLIHALALVVWRIRDVGVGDSAFASAPFVQIPEGQRWPLWLLYVVWALAVAILYAACRWFAARKTRSSSGWLRYL